MAGEADVSADQPATLTAWRDVPFYTEAEHAALALTEADTRLADGGTIGDEIWDTPIKVNPVDPS